MSTSRDFRNHRSRLATVLASFYVRVAVFLTLAAGIAAALVLIDQGMVPSAGTIKLEQAAFQSASAAQNPVSSSTWPTVRLPDNWSRERPQDQGIGIYRIRFDLPQWSGSQDGLGLFVKRLSMAGEFYINGHLLAPPVQWIEPVQRMWNTPQYRALPQDWLKPVDNELLVRVFGYRDYNAGLGAVHIGTNTEIYAVYQRALFAHSTFTAASLLSLLVISLLAFAISASHPSDGSSLLLGLCCLTWAARLVNDYLQFIPVSWFVWGWFTHSLGGWVVLLALMYCHRVTGIVRPKLERFAIGYTVVCTLMMGLYLGAWISKATLTWAWLPYNVALSSYTLYLAWRLLRSATALGPLLLATALGVFVVADVHDRLIVTALMPKLIGFEATYWRSLSAIFLAFAFSLLLADKFVRAVSDVANARAERQLALANERERLLREMHDGIGAHLVTALRGIERGALAPKQVVQSLQDSLDELRMLMDSTDVSACLPSALAAWRNRWDAKLAAAGVALDWLIDDSLDAITLSSDVALQVMRILHEAAANVVKHSRAQRMSLSAKVVQINGQQRLQIDISDDGLGLHLEANRAGARGLKNMHHRAKEIGAELTIASRIPPLRGCRVLLQMPFA